LNPHPRPLRISFDIDDTLVCHHTGARHEQLAFAGIPARWLGEPLRMGTRDLFRELKALGCETWIYTTSGRTPFHIKRWLLLYGIRVKGVINEETHRREYVRQNMTRHPSKYPPAFGIDLHVDDSEGVKIEGEHYNFRVIVVRPDDSTWTEQVVVAVKQLLDSAPETRLLLSQH
jgi:hypothetical protein